MEPATLIILLRREQARLEALRNTLIVHLAQQEQVEQRFTALLQLAQETLTLVLACPVETPPPADWRAHRNHLLYRLQQMLDEDSQTRKGDPPCTLSE